jgi:hypothetical protein
MTMSSILLNNETPAVYVALSESMNIARRDGRFFNLCPIPIPCRKVYVNDIVAHLKVPLDSSCLSEGEYSRSFIHEGLINHNYVEPLERITTRHRP